MKVSECVLLLALPTWWRELVLAVGLDRPTHHPPPSLPLGCTPLVSFTAPCVGEAVEVDEAHHVVRRVQRRVDVGEGHTS